MAYIICSDFHFPEIADKYKQVLKLFYLANSLSMNLSLTLFSFYGTTWKTYESEDNTEFVYAYLPKGSVYFPHQDAFKKHNQEKIWLNFFMIRSSSFPFDFFSCMLSLGEVRDCQIASMFRIK